MPDILIAADGISKTYGSASGRVTALADASFVVAAADRIALLGPSGSGKTTLLHLMAGIDVPTSGRLQWPALGARATLRPGPVAMAFQGPSLLPPLTVAENVALPLLLDGADDGEALERAWELLDAMSLTGIAEKLPEELSGGQMQRVGVARALVTCPRLLLADEPTGQLDHENAQALLDFVFDQVEASGAALVVATHDELIAARFPERWRMRDGVLTAAMADV